MSAVHAYCALCGSKTSVTWQQVPETMISPRNKDATTQQAKLVCADCDAKLPMVKPNNTIEK